MQGLGLYFERRTKKGDERTITQDTACECICRAPDHAPCYYENGDDEAAMLLPDGLVYSYLYPKFQREFSSW